MSYSPYNNYHHLDSTSNRNQDIQKSFDDINSKLRNLQADLHQARRPFEGTTATNFQPPDEYQMSPTNAITSHVHTFLSAMPNAGGAGGPKLLKKANTFSEPKSPRSPRNNPGALLIRSQTSTLAGRESSSPRSAKSATGKLSLDDIKTRLRKVFQFYTTFGDRCNMSNLKSNKFHKMMADAGVKDVFLTQKELDLLFVAENKHKPNMDFDTFLQLLVKVAAQRYDTPVSSRAILERFIKEHMLPLYANIYKHTDLAIEEERLKEPIEESVLTILKAMAPQLLKVYQVTFPWEIQTSQQLNVVRSRTEMALFTLLREFDICPALITKGSAFMIWTEVVETPLNELSRNPRIETMVPFLERDVGIVFHFSRFCTLLARIASIAYEEHLRAMTRKFSQAEKLIMLLERMDMSAGMADFEKKTHITHNSKTSLIVPKEVIQKASSYGDFDRQETSNYSPYGLGGTSFNGYEETPEGGRSRSAGKNPQLISGTNRASKSSKNLINTSQSIKRNNSYMAISASRIEQYAIEDPEVVALFEKHNESLTRIFQYYCSFGEPMNNTRLKSAKFIRMLKECGLITSRVKVGEQSFRGQEEAASNVLTQTDADLIFVTLTGTKTQRDGDESPMQYDPKIKSPNLGFFNHLYKNQQNVNNVGGRLGFEGFLKAIEMIAAKMLPDHDIVTTVGFILEKYLLQLDTHIYNTQASRGVVGGQSLKTLVELIKDPEMVNFLSLVHKSMMVYYSFYADSRGLMNFERFVQFCKDFSIFPDILSKARIKSFFQTLAAIHSQAENVEKSQQNVGTSALKKSGSQSRILTERKPHDQPEDELIDQHLFIEGLALCALEIPYNEPQPPNIAKICYFLERMNQSDGSAIVQKKMGLTRSPTGASWDILFFIKQKYPEMFGTKEADVTPTKANFADLVGNNWEIDENEY